MRNLPQKNASKSIALNAESIAAVIAERSGGIVYSLVVSSINEPRQVRSFIQLERLPCQLTYQKNVSIHLSKNQDCRRHGASVKLESWALAIRASLRKRRPRPGGWTLILTHLEVKITKCGRPSRRLTGPRYFKAPICCMTPGPRFHRRSFANSGYESVPGRTRWNVLFIDLWIRMRRISARKLAGGTIFRHAHWQNCNVLIRQFVGSH